MKIKLCFFLWATFILTGLTFCEKDDLPPENINDTDKGSIQPKDTVPLNPIMNLTYDSVTDIDGNVYKTIKIGSQVWMAENLKTTRYNDGNKIYKGLGGQPGHTDWFDLKVGAYVWWDNAESSSWGAHYNGYAAGQKNLCPKGWHVPTNPEWKTLLRYTGGGSVLMKSGTNASGFSAVVTGDLCAWGWCPGSCIFWTVDRADPYGEGDKFPYAYCVSLGFLGVAITDCSEPLSYGLNVRCTKDN